MAPRRDSNSANSSSSILVQHQLQQSQQQQPPQQPQQNQQHIHTFLYSTSLFNGANLLESNNGSTLITNNNNSDNLNANNNLNNSSNAININMSPIQTGNVTHATLNSTTTGPGGTNSGTQNGHHPQHVVSNINNNNNINNNMNGNVNGNIHDQYTRCCYPNGECLKLDACLIALDDLSDAVRVLCNNENCNMGQYMHRECFEVWEQAVLVTLKTMGRARSWSERQRTQNLWTKKGYDLVYKACVCKCGHGHIRKDLEWTPPVQKSSATLNGGQFSNVSGVGVGQPRVLLVNGGNVINIGSNSAEDDDKKKKKKRNRNNGSKSALATVNANGLVSNGQQQQVQLSSATAQTQLSLQQQQPTQVVNQQPQQQQSANSMHNSQQNSNGNISNAISAICTPNSVTKTTGNSITTNNAINTIICNNNSNQINALNNSSVGVIGSGLHNNNSSNLQQQQQPQSQQQQQQQAVVSLNNILGLDLRARADSLSSSGGGSGSTSPAASHSSADISISPIHHHQQQQQQQHQLQQHQQHQQNTLQLQQYQQSLLQQNNLTKSILNGALNGCVDTIQRSTTALLAATQPQPAGTPIVGGIGAVNGLNGLKQLSIFDQHLVQQQKNKEVELYSERVRLTSGCNGIFSRRLDFSSFNLLPKTRLNSYQVKIEDEGNHGNDETRLFILSSLAQSQMSRVACILCEEAMLVFDRYPLVDGSFFLSPKQHSNGCIEVKYEGRPLFLTCVCMACLDGTSTNRVINCRFCGEIWDGSNLVLGTMYAYDIFAAMPCCAERLKCNNCFKLLLHPQQRLNFYSDYSHCVTCPYCATQDTHFVKPLSFCYTKSNVLRHQSIA